MLLSDYTHQQLLSAVCDLDQLPAAKAAGSSVST